MPEAPELPTAGEIRTEAGAALRGQRRHIRIQPANPWFALNLAELWSFRDLFVVLCTRDVKLRYRQTALGVIWVILQPLLAAALFALIFGNFAALPSEGSPYLLFVFAALLPWNLFAGALQRGGTSLLSDARLISKVYFPRIVVPLAAGAAVLVDFAVAFVVMLLLLALYGVAPTLNLLVLPLLVLLVLLVSVGFGLLVAALSVYYRDFSYALPFILQVWLYASPLVYSADLVPPALRPYYALNPMVGVLSGFRWALLGQGDFPALALGLALAGSALLFITGVVVFQRIESNFADAI